MNKSRIRFIGIIPTLVLGACGGGGTSNPDAITAAYPTTERQRLEMASLAPVSARETPQAIAAASDDTASAAGAGAYTTTTVVNYPTGFTSSAGLSLVGGAVVSGGALELTTAGDWEAHAAWNEIPVNVQNFTTDFDFRVSPAGSNTADGFTFTVQNASVNAVGHYGGGLGYEGISSSVAIKFDLYNNAGEGTDSTGFYTHGATPTVPAINMTASGVNLHSGDILHAHITYSGTTLTLTLTDTVTNASFTTSTAINIPATVGANTAYVGFTAATGGLTSVQEILNWTFAVNSAVTPTFSPVAGTYNSAQSVTIADATPGAKIYYTTNGTTPTTASSVYGGAITVSASETLQAIAVASNYAASAVGSATYTISASSSPVVNYPTGFTSSAGLSLVGGAVVSGGALQLTTAGDWEARAAWNEIPVNVQNFTTDFDFQVSPAGSNTADGFTFTVQNASVNAVGHYGGGLGYEGIGSSVAIKFDLYNNAGEGTDSTGFYTHGATPTVPAINMTASGVNLHSGDILHAHITYSGTTLTLTLTDTVTNASFTTSTAINIPATVGANTAYVGFTAATGGDVSNQEILNWTYVTTVASACNPLSFGAIGDGTTDNTTAIQNAVTACAAQGGGIVELGVVGANAVYLTGPFVLQSNVLLEIDKGVTLQGTNDHSRYVGAYINWVYRPNEALISAKGASNVGIIGAGTIDGAGNQLQPNGSPSWWTLAPGMPTSARPWLLEFYQCNSVTISGVTLQNAPMWHQALRFSNNITESGVTVNAPGNSPNTDGVDLVGTTKVTLTNLNISVGDDNISIKSGLPIDPTDPMQVGLPQIATSQVSITNINAGNGHGISIGSEASNGVNNVTIQNVHYAYTGNGFRIKTGRDRGSQIYDITVEDLVMTGVSVPITLNDYYPAAGGPAEPPYQPAEALTPTTPYVHDITIENVSATGASGQSLIEGLPESCIHNVILNNVSIQTSSAGIDLRHMTGTFTNVTSTPAPTDPPFVVQENVTVTTGGTTPAITDTPPQSGQISCSAQVVP